MAHLPGAAALAACCLLALAAVHAEVSAPAADDPAVCAADPGSCTRGDVLLQKAQAASKRAALDEDPIVTGTDQVPSGIVGRRPPPPVRPPLPPGDALLQAAKQVVPPRPPPVSYSSLLQQQATQGILIGMPYSMPPELVIASSAAPAPASLLAVALGDISTPTDEEVAHYRELKALRQAGYTCPDGSVFAPNSNLFAFDCRLWRAARLHSADMGANNYFSHYSQNGDDPCARTLAQGFSPAACNENIAAGGDTTTGQAAFDLWKASSEHCPNMMNAGLNRFGVGSALNTPGQYVNYWTQDMGVADPANPWVDQSCNPPDTNEYTNAAQLPANFCRDLNPTGCAPFAGYAGTASCATDWTTSQCQKTCGYCTPTPTPSATTSDTCQDLQPTACAPWQGYAGTTYCTNYTWTQQNCQKTCGFCT